MSKTIITSEDMSEQMYITLEGNADFQVTYLFANKESERFTNLIDRHFEQAESPYTNDIFRKEGGPIKVCVKIISYCARCLNNNIPYMENRRVVDVYYQKDSYWISLLDFKYYLENNHITDNAKEFIDLIKVCIGECNLNVL